MGLLSVFVSCSDDDTTAIILQPEPEPMARVMPLVEFTALSNDNKVFYFNARNLNTPIKSYSTTVLQSGENVISIEYRQATGQLYGLGSTSRLYLINENSGLVTPLGSMPFTPQIQITYSSIDFNPKVDRVRLVSK